MKKIFAVICMVSGILFAQTENPKDVLFKRLTEKHSNVNEMSAIIDLNMSMFGATMKMPIKMWMKGNLFRMDTSMEVPGTDKIMQQTIIGDGN
ncbi:MAG: DUF4412 domain-containing protein, partial [bacterium]|nr:DUF4412 domain-containing protein [bacterium]